MKAFEIRDTRNGEWYWVNTAVNACPHITLADKAVYGALATLGGCSEIHPSYEEISKRSTVGIRQCKKSIKNLLVTGFISVAKGGGKGISNIYKLLKVSKGCIQCTVSKGCTEIPQTVNKSAAKGGLCAPQVDKEVDKEVDKTATSPKGSSRAEQNNIPMTLQEFIDWCKKSPQRHLHIIADYAEAKEPDCTTKAQWEKFIKRNLRPAMDLVPFTDEQIGTAAKQIYGAQWLRKWTLETLSKFLLP